MRIDNLMQIQQLYNSPSTPNVKKKDQTGKSFADQVQISSFGKDIQTAKSAVAAAKDIRQDKVAPIKESIANGTYEVSDEDLAEKLLSKFGL